MSVWRKNYDDTINMQEDNIIGKKLKHQKSFSVNNESLLITNKQTIIQNKATNTD